MMKQNNYDVIVIGAGMAGLTAGIYLKRSSLSSLVIEQDAPGGKLNEIHLIENYPAAPSISGPDLASKVIEQAESLGVEIQPASVISVNKTNNGFNVHTNIGDLSCKAVIIASGSSIKSDSIKGEKQFLGHGVSYCATCDGRFFKDKVIAVYGYKDHVVEDALYLGGLASKLLFFAPQELETTKAHLDALMKLPNLELHKDAKVVEIKGDNMVSCIEVEEEGKINHYEVSAFFPLSGEKSSSEFLSPLNLRNNKGFLVVSPNMETSYPGVFAAGDVIDKKLRQLINAAGEGAVAATSAISFIHLNH